MDKKDRFIAGENYIIDEGFNNSGIVKLISFEKYYCTVEDIETGCQWETMLHRLTTIKGATKH